MGGADSYAEPQRDADHSHYKYTGRVRVHGEGFKLLTNNTRANPARALSSLCYLHLRAALLLLC